MKGIKQSRKQCRTRKEEKINKKNLLKKLMESGSIMPGRHCNTFFYIVYTLVIQRTPPRDAFVLFVRNT